MRWPGFSSPKVRFWLFRPKFKGSDSLDKRIRSLIHRSQTYSRQLQRARVLLMACASRVHHAHTSKFDQQRLSSKFAYEARLLNDIEQAPLRGNSWTRKHVVLKPQNLSGNIFFHTQRLLFNSLFQSLDGLCRFENYSTT